VLQAVRLNRATAATPFIFFTAKGDKPACAPAGWWEAVGRTIAWKFEKELAPAERLGGGQVAASVAELHRP